jgi:hypothetical protein
VLRLAAGAMACAAAPLAATAPGAVAPEGISPGLATLITEFDATDAALNRFYHDAHNPACERERALLTGIENPTQADRARAFTVSGLAGMDDLEIAHFAIRRPLTHAIHAFPVASLADVWAKLAFIESDGGINGDDLLLLVQADVRRLLGETRA